MVRHRGNSGPVCLYRDDASQPQGENIPKKRLAVMLIGAGGNMRGAHLPRIAADGAVDIVGVADPVESPARSLMERAGRDVPYFRSWRTMLANVEADGVLISTPHRDHYPQVKACLEAGLHVLVEKPLVIRPGHAKRLLALSPGKTSRADRCLPAPLDAALRLRPRIGAERHPGRDPGRRRLRHPGLAGHRRLATRPGVGRRRHVHGHGQPSRRIDPVGHGSAAEVRHGVVRQRGPGRTSRPAK